MLGVDLQVQRAKGHAALRLLGPVAIPVYAHTLLGVSVSIQVTGSGEGEATHELIQNSKVVLHWVDLNHCDMIHARHRGAWDRACHSDLEHRWKNMDEEACGSGMQGRQA